MVIWHYGASENANKVNGINSTIWQIAKYQAKSGNDVYLMVNTKLKSKNIEKAKEYGIHLIRIKFYKFLRNKYILPDIVHFHSVFIPHQLLYAYCFRKIKIPFIITPNGGIDPNVLKRNKIKKLIFSTIFEKMKFKNASAIVAVLPQEVEEIKHYLPKYNGRIASISNPVESSVLKSASWENNFQRIIITYMGRFDVLHKGIDILFEVAKKLPEFEFHLYGSRDKKTSKLFDKMLLTAGKNVFIHEPIYGVEKGKILAESTIYFQTSRWEAFGISVAEALFTGLPVFITQTMKIADLIKNNDLGVVLSGNVGEIAMKIKEELIQRERLKNYSINASCFALKNFQPETIAIQYIQLYKLLINEFN